MRLFSRRNGLVRHALDQIIEQASTAVVTGNDVINAIRASCCLTDDGKWVEPTRTYVFTRQTPEGPVAEHSEAAAIAAAIQAAPEVKDLPPQALQSLIANLTIRT